MPVNALLSGAIGMASLVIALFFLRYWRSTGESLFIYFAISFTLESLLRVVTALLPEQSESNPGFYLIRLLSYLLILIAIIRKNQRRAWRSAEGTRSD